MPLVLGACALLSARPAASEPAADGKKALDEYFRGAVVGLSGSRVRLRYDFSDPAQLKDFTEGVPWPIERPGGESVTVADGRLAVRGSTGASHVAHWDGDLTVTFRLIPDGTKDIGGFLDDPDTTTDYAIFTIAETYFHGWDGKPGGDTGMSKFGKQWTTAKSASAGFRYLTYRRLASEPVPGRAIAFSFGRKGAKNLMSVDDLSLEANDLGNRMRSVVPGFYAIQSSLAVDDVVIDGTLAPTWLEEKKVALRTVKPIVAEPAAAGPRVDPAVAALVEAYRSGRESPTGLVKAIGDASRSDADRQAAAAALKAGPRRALPEVLEILYSPEPAIRAVGIDIVKGMTGKTYGYDPKASEKARGAAVQRIQKDVQEHPEILQGTGVK